MAGTSPEGVPIAFGTALYGAADDPVDTAIMHDGVGNNLLHYADSAGQVRVNACFPGTSLTFTGNAVSDIEASPTANQWYLMAGGILGPWPLTRYGDGQNGTTQGHAYKLRIRLRGKTTNASGSCHFALVLAPIGRAVSYLDGAFDHLWVSNAVTSTSLAWLGGATKGTGAYADYLWAYANFAQQWTTTVSAPESATVPRTIEQCLVALQIFAKTSNNAGVPQISSVNAVEFGGR